MRCLTIVFFFLAAFPALANDWDALEQPGAIAMMRHALAPGFSDPANFELRDCSTQRNLDARGRAQARAIGDAIRARGINFDRVFSSQWCRTLETARLLDLGPVEEAAALNSFFENRGNRDAQTRKTLDLLRETEGRLMVVTHQVNITAITGGGVASGEIIVIRLTDSGAEVIGSILIDP
ncbi:histidine phosphatase superfamily protein (branch 1) [Litoreibacter ponti]|uniref:Histidine phosphatase superfamily protein (Branch 1) n=1 Tax=Litoreibacter ponti TaxID=1510457 RepID=A0A2T6BFK1_9RHOB|nr:histidine phosphatase family protein [Litoreibacter ponti]PTX54827.1 histidine phosphatase superfamily protein (branch 1) [Litoreibacter ponti]